MAYGYPDKLRSAIVQAAKKHGIPDAANEMLAATLVESGGRLDAVGDSGNSHGPFQENRYGRGSGVSVQSSRDPVQSANRAAKEFAAFVKKGYSPKGFNPELAYAAQRPANKSDYIKKLNANLSKARQILAGGSDVSGVQTNEAHLQPKGVSSQPDAPDTPEIAEGERIGDDNIFMNSVMNALTDKRQSSSDRLRTMVTGLINQDISDLSNANNQNAQPDPDVGTTAQPNQKPKPQPKNEQAFKAGGGWGGTEGVIKSLVGPGVKANGLTVTSAKRDNKNPASGNRSDHHIGNKNAFAWDISNGSNPTPEMDAAASDIVRRLGGPADWGKTGGNFVKQVGGYQFQVIYRSQVGGNHDNHVHIGVHKV